MTPEPKASYFAMQRVAELLEVSYDTVIRAARDGVLATFVYQAGGGKERWLSTSDAVGKYRDVLVRRMDTVPSQQKRAKALARLEL